MSKQTLKQLRSKANETQKKTAESIGITRALYSHYENGLRVPKVTVASKLAEYFGVKVEDINFLNNNDTKSNKSI